MSEINISVVFSSKLILFLFFRIACYFSSVSQSTLLKTRLEFMGTAHMMKI